jgi:hypothetical protein
MQRRDFYAGGLLLLIGLGAAWKAGDYSSGTLRQTGPGYFPMLLALILAGLGFVIAAGAALRRSDGAGDEPVRPDWRGFVCIVSGVTAFIVLGRYGGLVPATFAAVFLAAIGDRSATLKSAGVLAGCVTIAGVLLFVYALKIQFPLFGG